MRRKLKRQIRAEFRGAVFQRDGYRCVICGSDKGPLDPHHIVGRSVTGYDPAHGVTLCQKHHLMAELGEINAATLYAKIKEHA